MADNKYYLDKSGLNFFWGRVKDWIAAKKFLSYNSQGLTNEERAQARSNIGAVAYEEQTLTSAQQAQARTNIGAISTAALPVAATASPLMDGTAAVGSSTKWAREDHIHPIDTSRAPLASPAFTGTPTAPNAVAGTSNSQIATTSFVGTAISSLNSAIATEISALDSRLDTLESNAVQVTAQTLTSAQQSQARANIGAQAVLTFDSAPDSSSSNPVTSSGIYNAIGSAVSDVVRFSEQSLTNEQASQAVENLKRDPNYLAVNYNLTNKTASTSVTYTEFLRAAIDYRYCYIGNSDHQNLKFEITKCNFMVESAIVELTGFDENTLVKITCNYNNVNSAPTSVTLTTLDLDDLATTDGIANTYVKYAAAQTLTSAQQSQARTNIGAGTYSKPSGGIPAADIASGVIPAAGTATPLVNGTAAVGTGTKWAREDHVHPIDTTRAPLASPTFTGTPKTVAITSASATNAIADKKYVDDAITSAAYSLPTATSSILGGVKIGSNIGVDANGVISVATASGITLGVVKEGKNVTISSEGAISVATASGNTLGVVKQGSYVTIASDGTISANEGSTSAKGVVKLADTISDTASDKSTTAATPNAVINYVSTQVATVFSYGGSVAFANLPAPSSSNVNKIYNITDSFTTTADFVEGAGKTYPAGTNIIIVDVGSGGTHTYKYDVTTGFIDLSSYATSSWVTNNFLPIAYDSRYVHESELIAITDAEISAIVV